MVVHLYEIIVVYKLWHPTKSGDYIQYLLYKYHNFIPIWSVGKYFGSILIIFKLVYCKYVLLSQRYLFIS